ncbi:MAG: bifunctional precorrin-2 dehydrogenase/sirohydrochlorin ferrochelatase [Vampirovibrionales bacterium]|nr:bifunctional precorrin-2 dehydrogenase/sirohydrochlorin ferrochelatase [Vampirovibrionales bacterium]
MTQTLAGNLPPPLFPAFLNLTTKTVALVGGGAVAAQKLSQLLACGARVRLISPLIRPQTQALLDTAPHLVEIRLRPFALADLSGAHLLITATDDPQVNREAVEAARRLGIWANSVDDPPFCDFFAASTVDRGPVRVAISTQGRFPGFSAALRKTLEAWLPDAHLPDMERLFALRAEARRRIPSSEARAAALKAICAELEARYFGPLMQEAAP